MLSGKMLDLQAPGSSLTVGTWVLNDRKTLNVEIGKKHHSTNHSIHLVMISGMNNLFYRFTAFESFRGGLRLSLNPSFQTIRYYPKVSIIDLIRVVEKEDSVYRRTIFHQQEDHDGPISLT